MMVTHDVGCALREARNVLSMCRGHSFFGTVAAYERHERLDEAADEILHHHSHEGHSAFAASFARELGRDHLRAGAAGEADGKGEGA